MVILDKDVRPFVHGSTLASATAHRLLIGLGIPISLMGMMSVVGYGESVLTDPTFDKFGKLALVVAATAVFTNCLYRRIRMTGEK